MEVDGAERADPERGDGRAPLEERGGSVERLLGCRRRERRLLGQIVGPGSDRALPGGAAGLDSAVEAHAGEPTRSWLNRRMTYVPAAARYDSMRYNRCGASGLRLPAISLGL